MTNNFIETEVIYKNDEIFINFYEKRFSQLQKVTTVVFNHVKKSDVKLIKKFLEPLILTLAADSGKFVYRAQTGEYSKIQKKRYNFEKVLPKIKKINNMEKPPASEDKIALILIFLRMFENISNSDFEKFLKIVNASWVVTMRKLEQLNRLQIVNNFQAPTTKQIKIFLNLICSLMDTKFSDLIEKDIPFVGSMTFLRISNIFTLSDENIEYLLSINETAEDFNKFSESENFPTFFIPTYLTRTWNNKNRFVSKSIENYRDGIYKNYYSSFLSNYFLLHPELSAQKYLSKVFTTEEDYEILNLSKENKVTQLLLSDDGERFINFCEEHPDTQIDYLADIF